MVAVLDDSNNSFSNPKWGIGMVAPRETWAENTLLKNDKDVGTSDRKGDNNIYTNRVKVSVVGYHDQIQDPNELPFASVLGNPFIASGYGSGQNLHQLEGGESVLGLWIDGDDEQKFVITNVFMKSQYGLDIATKNLKSNSYVRPYVEGSGVEVAQNTNVEGEGVGTNTSIKGKTFSTLGKTTTNETFDSTGRNTIVLDSFASGSGKGQTNAHKFSDKMLDRSFDRPTCKNDGAVGAITGALQDFSKLLISAEKYGNFYVDAATGLLINFEGEIDLLSRKIGGLMTAKVNGIRDSVFSSVEEKINSFTNKLIPEELKPQFSEGINGIMDNIYCLFGNVIGGLKNMIGNFLKELVGKFLNAPLCAAEQFLGTLLGDIMGSINGVIGPILSSLTAVLGGALGSVNSLINKALAGVGLLHKFIACNEFKCPLPSRFDNKLGPKQNDVDRIDKITKTMSSLSDGLGGTNLPSVFEKPEGDPSTVAALVGECETNVLRCGPPIIEIFGGSGVDGAANAVVSEIGEIIGADIVNRGLGYQEKAPYVTFRDACGDGNSARGKAIINPDDGGIDKILIESPGYGYNNSFNRVITIYGELETDTVSELANTNSSSVTGQIDEVVVARPGFGYNPTDTLEAGNADLEPVILGGRIVAVKVNNSGNGFTSIPEIEINSETGIGADLRSVLKFVPVSEVSEALDPTQVIEVVDCVEKPLTRNRVGA